MTDLRAWLCLVSVFVCDLPFVCNIRRAADTHRDDQRNSTMPTIKATPESAIVRRQTISISSASHVAVGQLPGSPSGSRKQSNLSRLKACRRPRDRSRDWEGMGQGRTRRGVDRRQRRSVHGRFGTQASNNLRRRWQVPFLETLWFHAVASRL
ncbi:unnamed protein product [Ectocarpus sp. 12 AP-2014]